MMSTNIKKSDSGKRVIMIWVAVLALILVYTCLVVPFYIATAKNVVYSDSIIPFLLYVLKTLVECAVTALLFGYCARSIFVEKEFNSKGYFAKLRFYGFIVPVIFIFLEFVLNQIAALITKEINEFSDVFAGLATPVLDILLVLVVAITVAVESKQHIARAREVEKAAKFLGKESDAVGESVFPFRSFVSFKNPVLKALFIGSALLGLCLIGQRIFIDIGYGAPTSVAEVREMILYYLSDILQAIAVYTGSYFTASFLSE